MPGDLSNLHSALKAPVPTVKYRGYPPVAVQEYLDRHPDGYGIVIPVTI